MMTTSDISNFDNNFIYQNLQFNILKDKKTADSKDVEIRKLQFKASNQFISLFVCFIKFIF